MTMVASALFAAFDILSAHRQPVEAGAHWRRVRRTRRLTTAACALRDIGLHSTAGPARLDPFDRWPATPAIASTTRRNVPGTAR